MRDPGRGFFVEIFMARFIQYIKDTRGEMRHVSWPTQTQTLIYTALVIIISLITAMYLGFFDFLFTSSLDAGLDTIAPGRNATIPQELGTPPNGAAPEGNTGGVGQPAFDFTTSSENAGEGAVEQEAGAGPESGAQE